MGLLAMLVLSALMTQQEPYDLGQHFGFDAFQIYKAVANASQLRIADVDGDGRQDIAYWNGERNRIELYLQPSSKEAAATHTPSTDPRERNAIVERGPMRNVSVPVSYRVACMQVAEMTGDKLPDIVFFGEPKELVILPGKGDGQFGAAISIRAPEGIARDHAMTVGDFNSDGRADVALLTDDAILIYPQRSDGGLAKPTRVPHSLKSPGLMLTSDLNGDQRDDLVINVDDTEYGVYVCLQGEAGGLGALQRVRAPRYRSMTIAPNKGGDDVYCIEMESKRLKLLRWAPPAEEALGAEWPLSLYSYPARGKSQRKPITFGDVNGDGRIDMVSAEPDAAQLVVFYGTADGLSAGVSFPGLVKTVDLAIADLDGDGHNEVLSASREEKTLGVSTFDSDGRLTFPKPIETQGAPVLVAMGGLRVGEPSRCLAYVAVNVKNADGGDAGAMLYLQNGADGKSIASISLGELKDDPSGLRFADVNQDGLNDLLLFVRFTPVSTFVQQADGAFQRLDGPAARGSLLKENAIEDYAYADIDGDNKPEVILAQKGLARALRVVDGAWTVVDQYNPDIADAELKGLAVLPGASPTIVMYDKKSRELLAMKRREDGAFAVTQSTSAGVFDPLAMAATGAGKDQRVILADTRWIGVFSPQSSAPTLVEQQAYESAIKDVWMSDSVVGDLNSDGVRDVVLVDVRRAFLEILTTQPDGELKSAMNFQVFQGKRLGREDEGGEPRQVLCGDVTGDGLDDLVALTHDRLIVYPAQR